MLVVPIISSNGISAPKSLAKKALNSIATKLSTPFELTDFPGSMFSTGITSKEKSFALTPPDTILAACSIVAAVWSRICIANAGSDSNVPDLLLVTAVLKWVNRG